MLRNPIFTNEMKIFDLPKSCAVLGQSLEFHRNSNSRHWFPPSPHIKFTLHHTATSSITPWAWPAFTSTGALFSTYMWTNGPIMVSGWHRRSAVSFGKSPARGKDRPEGALHNAIHCFIQHFSRCNISSTQQRGLLCSCSWHIELWGDFKLHFGKVKLNLLRTEIAVPW